MCYLCRQIQIIRKITEQSMLLSIVIPVFNEASTLLEIIGQVQAADCLGLQRELILIDDFSTDGSRELISGWQGSSAPDKTQPPFDRPVQIILQPHNQGKGAALRAGFAATKGDLVIVQDADLEYDPNDYAALLTERLSGRGDVIYGSRFMGDKKNMSGLHKLGNLGLTTITNLLYGVRLTDMETCYKLFPGELLRSLDIKSERFNFEPEITAKVLNSGLKIKEVPISYKGRHFSEGKKITWRDGFAALIALIKYRFSG